MHFMCCFLIVLGMLKDYLETEIYNLIIKNFNFNDITEIRMRANQKLVICIKNKKYFLKDANNNYVVVSQYSLERFIKRFFSQQFKRSCSPDGIQVCELSLSPRGAFKMSSDMSCKGYLDDLANA